MDNKKIDKNIECFESKSGKIIIEDGVDFIKSLKEEAKRQKSEKIKKEAESIVQQINNYISDPETDKLNELADSFEIFEE